ncbi:hypothetical protein V0288_24735, partial [Pannus brasiliensis CCIBt3594]
LIWGLIFGLIFGLIWGLIFGLIWGLIFGLIFGLIWGLISTFKQDLKSRSYPNQGIYNSLQSTLWISSFSYPISVVVGIITVWDRLSIYEQSKNHEWIHSIGITFPESLISGLGFALFFGFFLGGGVACVQHIALRIVLWQSGAIPWNFARFLNYCVERRLLLRTGGHYRFLHRELLDHFAHSHPPSRRVG